MKNWPFKMYNKNWILVFSDKLLYKFIQDNAGSNIKTKQKNNFCTINYTNAREIYNDINYKLFILIHIPPDVGMII